MSKVSRMRCVCRLRDALSEVVAHRSMCATCFSACHRRGISLPSCGIMGTGRFGASCPKITIGGLFPLITRRHVRGSRSRVRLAGGTVTLAGSKLYGIVTGLGPNVGRCRTRTSFRCVVEHNKTR